MIAASKPDIPTVDPIVLPYEYNANDFQNTYTHNAFEILGMDSRDILLGDNGMYVLRMDQDGNVFEQFWGYITFNKSHDYMGCYRYVGSHPDMIYGAKYHLYKEADGNGYYYILCNE